MKWYGIDEDIYIALVELITEVHECAKQSGDMESETYYFYLLGELEECKVVARGESMNSDQEQRLLKLKRYLKMLHDGLKLNDIQKKSIKNKTPKRYTKKMIPQSIPLKEIKSILINDPELTNKERFDLYYDEYLRVKKESALEKIKPLDVILKELGIDKYNNKKI